MDNRTSAVRHQTPQSLSSFFKIPFVISVCLLQPGTPFVIHTAASTSKSFLRVRHHPSSSSYLSSSASSDGNSPHIWTEEAESGFVDPDDNLERGKECLLALKSLASPSSSSTTSQPRFLSAGALVRRAPPPQKETAGDTATTTTPICDDAWMVDAILDEGDGGPNLQFLGAQMILDELFLIHLKNGAGGGSRKKESERLAFVVRCGSEGCDFAAASSRYPWVSHRAALSRGFRLVTYDEDGVSEGEGMVFHPALGVGSYTSTVIEMSVAASCGMVEGHEDDKRATVMTTTALSILYHLNCSGNHYCFAHNGSIKDGGSVWSDDNSDSYDVSQAKHSHDQCMSSARLGDTNALYCLGEFCKNKRLAPQHVFDALLLLDKLNNNYSSESKSIDLIKQLGGNDMSTRGHCDEDNNKNEEEELDSDTVARLIWLQAAKGGNALAQIALANDVMRCYYDNKMSNSCMVRSEHLLCFAVVLYALAGQHKQHQHSNVANIVLNKLVNSEGQYFRDEIQKWLHGVWDSSILVDVGVGAWE